MTAAVAEVECIAQLLRIEAHGEAQFAVMIGAVPASMSESALAVAALERAVVLLKGTP
ncbi:hypothetical protein [Sandarakinorhabdus sp.]|uniref:hypothetical protein n=1 Tax=Sandarakinorhabdus sp. TaxID=1916663 RepID=UPI00286E747F|nr:hypothetical protein [Sandarakinorhabdus sp.]